MLDSEAAIILVNVTVAATATGPKVQFMQVLGEVDARGGLLFMIEVRERVAHRVVLCRSKHLL
jgi:hypothetical protein